ncbi:MAG: cupin domain-containing protein [Gaiellaceae bacterium]
MDALGDIAAVPPQQIWDGITGRAVHGERLTLGLIELAPNAVLPEHRHENEQLGLVIEGSITFTIGTERRTLGPGGTWRIPGNVPHEAVIGPEGAVVVDVFSPVREDWKALPETESPPPPIWPS